MMELETRVVSASTSRRRRRRKLRRILKKRRRRNETRVKAPSSLPNDALEEIFLRFPIKALIRLKSLSKQWRSTIESLSFAEKHLKIAKQASLNHPKVMIVSEEHPFNGIGVRTDTDVGFRSFCLESSSHLSFTPLNFSPGFVNCVFPSQSCDGLFCIHSPISHSVYVVNPAIRWFRQLPPAGFQILINKNDPTHEWIAETNLIKHLAFVKAADYKLVWLYNSDKYIADPNEGVTKCEVFDFRANAWRYLPCTPSYRIFYDQKPACANGFVYWFTEPYNARIQVVAFDIHTETFRILPKIHQAIAVSDPHHIDMCTLDDSLCMSKREQVTMIQDIWRLKPYENTWEKIYSIDLVSCSSASRVEIRDTFDWRKKDLIDPSTPIAICKDKKILLSHRYSRALVKYDPLEKSLDFFFIHPFGYRKVVYFPSLISHL